MSEKPRKTFAIRAGGMGYDDAPADVPPQRLWLEEAWAMPAEDRAVEVEGAAVRYRAWGLDDGRDKPGLILVHGFIAHARWWDHIAPWFADRYRVAAINLSGMGDSDRRPAYSRKQYAREVLAVAHDAGLAPLTIVAHSFGAITGLYAAHLEPDLVERAVVIDAHPFRTGESRLGAVPAEKFYATREEALARYRLSPPGAWPDRDVLAHVAQHSLRQTPQGWGWKFDPATFAASDREEMTAALRGLAVPVDYIHAARSDFAGMDAIDAFVAAMPTCGVPVSLPFCHHHAMIEQPVALVAALNGLFAHPRTKVTA
ncbi:alpha/beta hydrolase [Novosphingobium sp. KCTC 2891]|uniref:alpha/beta fold hydrolase n=1 Tax=Novosphingobium sp. KCTC 2891 TaxID=2989730 RepID=UPI0022214B9E|nr:alpha/beta hydrolase [Novosphingobium sp. KCTC 2891]MCW1383176.1 alpha/beta hydrolase [Novosphingobium sp. KCTC 2891]